MAVNKLHTQIQTNTSVSEVVVKMSKPIYLILLDKFQQKKCRSNLTDFLILKCHMHLGLCEELHSVNTHLGDG